MEIRGGDYHKPQDKEDCVICLDDIDTEWRELECRHRYHKKCIDNWITVRAKCPMCMTNIKDITIENENNNNVWCADYISIRRFVLFMSLIIGIIIVMVLCSS
jgi:hypothetical protein